VEGQTPVILRWPETGPMRVGLALQIGDVAGRRTITPLSWPWADYHEAVTRDASDEDLDAIVAQMRNLADAGATDLLLPDIRAGGVLERICQKLGGEIIADTHVSGIDLTVPDYVVAQAEKREFQTKRRRLNRRGEMQLVRHQKTDALRFALERFVTLHTRQWAGCADAVAPFTAFNRDFFRESPGHLMLQTLLAHCAAEGLHAFDFMRGGYAYKRDYSTWSGQNILWRWTRKTQ
jgi:CelD/BcsL family acetyltransferase involved in cellulose biosynthesis